MPTRVRLFFSIFSVVLFLIAAAPLYRELSRPKDIWWTPRTRLVPLARSQDRVEIYLRGKPLGTLIEAGQLRLTDERGSSVLTPNEIGLRFNNWDRVRAEHLPMSLVSAAAGGTMVLLFILVATGRLTYRDDLGVPNLSGRHPRLRG
ncbi:MAG: hypothetical protein M3P18_18380 [Actinomycetota bacterium]|nr:hypothetical protein [Actinomycetota bacterium]